MPTRTRRRDGRRLAAGRGEETKERPRAKRVIRNVQRCGSFWCGRMRNCRMERVYNPIATPLPTLRADLPSREVWETGYRERVGVCRAVVGWLSCYGFLSGSTQLRGH